MWYNHFAGGGAHTPVAVGAIGERTNRCLAASSPAPACDLALFRCIMFFRIRGGFLKSEYVPAKDVPILGASFVEHSDLFHHEF